MDSDTWCWPNCFVLPPRFCSYLLSSAKGPIVDLGVWRSRPKKQKKVNSFFFLGDIDLFPSCSLILVQQGIFSCLRRIRLSYAREHSGTIPIFPSRGVLLHLKITGSGTIWAPPGNDLVVDRRAVDCSFLSHLRAPGPTMPPDSFRQKKKKKKMWRLIPIRSPCRVCICSPFAWGRRIASWWHDLPVLLPPPPGVVFKSPPSTNYIHSAWAWRAFSLLSKFSDSMPFFLVMRWTTGSVSVEVCQPAFDIYSS